MVARFFRGRQLILTILVILGFGGLCLLGNWQWSRHVQRQAINAYIDSRMHGAPVPIAGGPVDPQALDYQRVTLSGTYENDKSVLLRNRDYQTLTGFHLLTPLRLVSGDVVLVDRGWVPYSDTPQQARLAYPQPGQVQIDGVARKSEAGLGGPTDPPFSAERPRIDAWFQVNVERIGQQNGEKMLPIFVELQPGPTPSSAPPFAQATTDLGDGPHLGYALQWYGFGVILVVGYIVMIIRGDRRKPARPARASQAP